MTNKDALWTRVVRGKYRCGDDIIPMIDKRRKGSRLWSGVKEVWDTFLNGIEVEQRNVNTVVRWKHEKSGVFSTKSAYSMIIQGEKSEPKVWPKL